MTTDPDHKFELSLQLDDLDAALDIVRTLPAPEAKRGWKTVVHGDWALAARSFDFARERVDANSVEIYLRVCHYKYSM